jgi:hypothetical protein
MTLQQWAESGWLKPHAPSREEMANLLAIVDRDLEEAAHAASPDWRLGIAYNAALKLCAVLLHASGYRAAHGLQHYRTITALPLILGGEREADAAYLDSCRLKRNTVEYERVGAVTEGEASELIDFVGELREAALTWLKDEHPELAPS